MTKSLPSSFSELAIQQGAIALLDAIFSFLRRNDISNKLILESMRRTYGRQKLRGNVRQYKRLIQAYEDMGIVMSTWFSLPRFLDRETRPLPLTPGRGS